MCARHWYTYPEWKNEFFISSVVSASLTHTHSSCNKSPFSIPAAKCHMVFPSLSVANKISLFISSVVSFLLAHSHCFSNTFTLTYSAVQCQAFLPLQSLGNNSLSNSSAIRFFFQPTPIISLIPVCCATILPSATLLVPFHHVLATIHSLCLCALLFAC